MTSGSERPVPGDDYWQDLAQRSQADLINYRNRMQRELAEREAKGQSALLSGLLPVFDQLDLARGAVDTDSAVAVGLRLLHDELIATLERFGITLIVAGHEVFDPAEHEAVGVIAAGEIPAGYVAEMLSPGYRHGERVIRPARCVVAR
jgi:molecular chaperone GrpE